MLALLGSGLLTALLDRPPALEPLAALIMEQTPVPIANGLLALFGPAGKPLALYGASALVLGIGGPLALLAGGRWLGRWGLPVAMMASALLAAPLLRPGALPGVLALSGLFWLALLLPGHLAPVTIGRSLAPSEQVSRRRRALIVAATNTLGLLTVSGLPVVASAIRSAAFGRSIRPPVFPYIPPPPRQNGFALAGLTPEVTPVADFYRMSKNVADPVLDASTWSLSLSGAVRHRLTLTLDDLAALPRTDHHVTMQCVSNPVGGPLWSAACFSGVPLADLLARAGPLPDAGWIDFEGHDGHREQLALDRALDPLILVAYAMNGAWLEPSHGFPARLLATGLYGFRSVKWLTRIDVTAAPRPGHWEARGWTAAEIHATARVDLVQATPDGVLAAGVAFGGRRGVSAVEVRVNGGAWEPATLHRPPVSDAMWVQWRAPLDLPLGREVLVEARAFDGTGQSQDEAARGQFPGGATGLHGLTVTL